MERPIEEDRDKERTEASEGQSMTDKHAREKEKKGEKASCKKEGGICTCLIKQDNKKLYKTSVREPQHQENKMFRG